MWGKNSHICEVELQVEIDESAVIIEEFNTPLLEKNRFSRQEISKDIVDLNSTVNQLDLINIYKNFIQQQNSHMKHSAINILCHKTHYNKYKRSHTKNVFRQIKELKLESHYR